MWYETFQLHAARRLEQDDSVALQSGLKLRPEIFDIRRSDHALALIPFFQRRRELTDSSDDVGAGRQREISDVGVTLLGRRTQLSHRTKDDYPLSSATSSLEQLDCGAGRSGVRVVSVVDQRNVTQLFPRRTHLRLGHARDARRGVGVAHAALARHRQGQHYVTRLR